MPHRVKLRELCHGRSGDKGHDVNVGIAVYDAKHYEWLKRTVTTEVITEYVSEYPGDEGRGPVTRYELPKLGAVNFVIPGGLLGGVTRSIQLDGHGKSFSQILLDMEVEAPVEEGELEMNDKEILRLGTGSAHGWDNLEAALELANSGECEYLIFDCLSEKVALIWARNRQENRAPGWDPRLESRMRLTIPACASTQTKIVTNVGASNPAGAAVKIKELCAEVGVPHLKVMAVVGDNVFDLIRKLDPLVEETGQPVSAFGDRFRAASAYCPVRPLVEALDQGADIVVSGRAGDSTQYLAPMLHEFGWAADWGRLAKGLGIGHLMECGAQITGGYFADPPYKIVPDLHRVGFPIALVEPSGDADITKLPGTGGVISRMTAIEQLLYEIGDPANYKHNDAIVNFTSTDITEVGPDRVRITGTSGHPKPATIKVCLGVHEEYFGYGETSYAGDSAYERAKLAADVVAGRMAIKGFKVSKLRFDFVGVNSIFPWKGEVPIPKEVRLRVAGVFPTWEEAETLYGVVGELPCNGPSGSTWGRDADGGGVEEITGMYTTLVPQEMIQREVVDISQMAETSSS